MSKSRLFFTAAEKFYTSGDFSLHLNTVKMFSSITKLFSLMEVMKKMKEWGRRKTKSSTKKCLNDVIIIKYLSRYNKQYFEWMKKKIHKVYFSKKITNKQSFYFESFLTRKSLDINDMNRKNKMYWSKKTYFNSIPREKWSFFIAENNNTMSWSVIVYFVNIDFQNWKQPWI